LAPRYFLQFGLKYLSDPSEGFTLRQSHYALSGNAGSVWFLGFGFHSHHNSYYAPELRRTQFGTLRIFTFPHWFLALLLAVLPALRLRAARRSRRSARAGLCPTCGYDLRATPDRCPECGSSIA
jgi:hypothetical protein